jgi:hypothetical protein
MTTLKVSPVEFQDRVSSTSSPSGNQGLINYFIESKWEANNKETRIVESLIPTWERELFEQKLFNEIFLTEDVKLGIIHTFSSKLVENMIDLDPEITKIVDDNFWELL